MMDLDPCVPGPPRSGPECRLRPPPPPTPRDGLTLSGPSCPSTALLALSPSVPGLDLGQPCVRLRQHVPRVSSLNKLSPLSPASQPQDVLRNSPPPRALTFTAASRAVPRGGQCRRPAASRMRVVCSLFSRSPQSVLFLSTPQNGSSPGPLIGWDFIIIWSP